MKLLITTLLAGALATGQEQHNHASAPTQNTIKQPDFTCPMHKDVHQPAPGKCPICNMNLEPSTQGQATGPKLSLQRLEQMALGNHPALKQAAAMVEAAGGRAHQAGLRPNPVIGANGEHVSRVTGGGAIGGFVEQRFVTAGKLGLDRKIALQEQAGVKQEEQVQRQRLLNAVRALYYQALGDQMLLEVRTNLVDLARKNVAIFGELANVGLADKPDQLAAEIEAERIEAELTNAQNAREKTWRQLAAITNNQALKPAPLEGNLEELPKLNIEQSLEAILQDSPELKEAEVAVTKSKLALRRAEVEKIPDINLRGGLRNNREYGEIGPLGPTRRRGLEGIFDAGIQIPLFNRNQGGVKAARAEAEISRLDVERTKLSLHVRLAAAYKEYADASSAAERYRTRMLPKARQAYELYSRSFKQMASAYPQVLNAQRNLFQIQDGYVTALVATWRSAVEIQGLLLSADPSLMRAQ